MNPSLLPRSYTAFLDEPKQRISAARVHAARAVNFDLVLLYWDIGKGIVEQQENESWGEAVVERLARDLQRAFPEMQGFSPASVWRMRQLFEAYSSPEFLAQAVRESRNVPKGTKDDIEVEFALKTKTNPIGVAEYELRGRLPAEFKGRLPTAKQLADAVREALP